MPSTTLDTLTREECFRLLGTLPVGRLAVNTPETGPLVVPVNFVLDGEVVVFRSAPGSKLRVLLRGNPVSFQADFVDWYHRTGWSVLVRGVAYEATPWEIDHLPVDPWPGGDKLHWVRLVASEVTGRRLEQVVEYATGARAYL